MATLDSKRRAERGSSLERKILMYGSLVAVVAGFPTGILVFSANKPNLFKLVFKLEILGIMWAELLSLVLIPAIFGYIVVIVARSLKARSTGIISGLALVVHVGLMILATIYVLLMAPVLVEFSPKVEVSPSNHPLIDDQPSSASLPESSETSFSRALGDMENTVKNLIFPTLLLAVLWGIVLARLPSRIKERWLNVFERLGQTAMGVIRKIVIVMPIAIYLLLTAFTARSGLPVAGIGLFFVVYICLLLFVFNLLLYPIGALIGKIPFKAFSKALVPAQMMAVGTRSSLLCLPVLIDSAENQLKLPREVSELVLPLSVTMFRFNWAISGAAKLFIVAHIYDIKLSGASIGMFIFMKMIMSFSAPGIPGGAPGMGGTLPLYLAAGIPVEGVLIFLAIEDIPDMFKTALNVSEDLTIAVIVARWKEKILTKGIQKEG